MVYSTVIWCLKNMTQYLYFSLCCIVLIVKTKWCVIRLFLLFMFHHYLNKYVVLSMLSIIKI